MSNEVNTNFGSIVNFKENYKYSDCVIFEKSDTFQVANYWHKRHIQLHHPRLPKLVKIKYEQINNLLENHVPSLSTYEQVDKAGGFKGC